MLLLKMVTITGADDSVKIKDLEELSEEFPFVEWGILFDRSSRRHTLGNPRYPSVAWITDLLSFCPNLRLSAHLCGGWVEDFVLFANFSWEIDQVWDAKRFGRVQINFHSQFHRYAGRFPAVLEQNRRHAFILQCDGVNDRIANMLASAGTAYPLFDTSGGTGMLPHRWPGVYCGYAGGLGPENVVEQLNGPIRKAASGQPFWIDMERNVRSTNDQIFDLKKVRTVLQRVRPFIAAE